MDQQLEILFKEYDSLRREIISRTNNGYQMASIGAAGGAGLASWIVSAHVYQWVWITIVFLGVAAFVITSIALNYNIQAIARRLRKLERLINEKAGEGNLLAWELEYAWKNRTPRGIFGRGKPPDDVQFEQKQAQRICGEKPMNGAPAQLSSEQNEQITKLHVAEYQSLMTRSTALVTIMFTVMTIGFAYLGLIISVWPGKANGRLQLLWGCLLPEQVIILFWLSLLYSQYGVVLYVETELRRLCGQSAGGPACFWSYESFWQRESKGLYKLPELLPSLTSLFAVVGVLYYRFFGYPLLTPHEPWSAVEICAAITSGLLWVLTLEPTKRIRQMRQKLECESVKRTVSHPKEQPSLSAPSGGPLSGSRNE